MKTKLKEKCLKQSENKDTLAFKEETIRQITDFLTYNTKAMQQRNYLLNTLKGNKFL